MNNSYTNIETINLINFLYPLVYDIRKRLAKRYPVNNSNIRWYKYRGLCDMAVDILEAELRIHNSAYGTNYRLKVIHGEQAHTPRIESDEWINQHTWCYVTDTNSKKVYVDPTSSQFQNLYPEIPDFYISEYSPKWYLPDKRNIMYFINSSLYRRLIYFFQFSVWGNISDIIHKMVRRR